MKEDYTLGTSSIAVPEPIPLLPGEVLGKPIIEVGQQQQPTASSVPLLPGEVLGKPMVNMEAITPSPTAAAAAVTAPTPASIAQVKPTTPMFPSAQRAGELAKSGLASSVLAIGIQDEENFLRGLEKDRAARMGISSDPMSLVEPYRPYQVPTVEMPSPNYPGPPYVNELSNVGVELLRNAIETPTQGAITVPSIPEFAQRPIAEARKKALNIKPPSGIAERVIQNVPAMAADLPTMFGAGAATPGPPPVKVAAALAAPTLIKYLNGEATLNDVAWSASTGAAIGSFGMVPAYGIIEKTVKALGDILLYSESAALQEGKYAPSLEDLAVTAITLAPIALAHVVAGPRGRGTEPVGAEPKPKPSETPPQVEPAIIEIPTKSKTEIPKVVERVPQPRNTKAAKDFYENVMRPVRPAEPIEVPRPSLRGEVNRLSSEYRNIIKPTQGEPSHAKETRAPIETESQQEAPKGQTEERLRIRNTPEDRVEAEQVAPIKTPPSRLPAEFAAPLVQPAPLVPKETPPPQPLAQPTPPREIVELQQSVVGEEPKLEPSELVPGKAAATPQEVANRLGLRFDAEVDYPDAKYRWIVTDPDSPANKATFYTEKADLESVMGRLEEKEAEFSEQPEIKQPEIKTEIKPELKSMTNTEFNAKFEALNKAYRDARAKFVALYEDGGKIALIRYRNNRGIPSTEEAKAEDLIHGLITLEANEAFLGNKPPTVEEVLGKQTPKPKAKGPKPKKPPQGPAPASYFHFAPDEIFSGFKRVHGAVKKAAQRMERVVDMGRSLNHERQKAIAREAAKSLNRGIFSPSVNIENILDRSPVTNRILWSFELTRGSSPIVDHLVKDVYNESYKDLSWKEGDALNIFASMKRTSELEKQGRLKIPEKGAKVGDASSWLEALNKANPSLYTKLEEHYQPIKAANRYLLDFSNKHGLLMPEEYNALKRLGGNYSVRQFLKYIDGKVVSYSRQIPRLGAKISIGESGFKHLNAGDMSYLERDQLRLLNEAGRRIVGRALKNRASMALWEFTRDNPKMALKQFGFRIVKPIRAIKGKAGRYIWPTPKSGEALIEALDKGDQRGVMVPASFADEWHVVDPNLNKQALNLIGWLSGAKEFKVGATGVLTPFFFLGNLPRDYQFTVIRNPDLVGVNPITGTGRMIASYINTFSDAAREKGLYDIMREEGGSLEFLATQGHMTTKAFGAFRDIEGVIGKINRASEIWTRLVVMDRVIKARAEERGISYDDAAKDPDIQMEAAYRARTNIDFGRSGSVGRTVEAFSPYTTAGLAAVDGMRRGIRSDAYRRARERGGAKPDIGDYTYRNRVLWNLASVTALMVSAGLVSRLRHPRAYEETSMYDKVNYLPIYTGLWYKDENGDKRYIYFRLAKDQSVRATSVLADAMIDHFLGYEIDTDAIKEGLANIWVVSPTSIMPPMAKSLYGLNKDWDLNKGKSIGLSNVYGKEDWDEKTKEMYKELGKHLDISPNKVQAAVESLITNNDVLKSVNMLTEMWNKPISDEEMEKFGKKWYEEIQNIPGLSRLVGVTDPNTPEYETTYKAREALSTKRIAIGRDVDALVDSLVAKDKRGINIRGLDEKDTPFSYIKKLENKNDQSFAQERAVAYWRAKVLNLGEYWETLRDLPPDIREANYLSKAARLKKSDPKGYKDFMFKLTLYLQPTENPEVLENVRQWLKDRGK